MPPTAASPKTLIGPIGLIGPIDNNTERRYIKGIVQHYCSQAGYKFITPLDFHFLSEWYSQGIPLSIIKESISTITRRRGRVSSMWSFDSHIQRAYRAYLQIRVGASMPDQGDKVDGAEAGQESEVDPELTPDQEEQLLKEHEQDEELKIKTAVFLKYLSPGLRTVDVRRRFQINYLIHRRKT